MESGNRRRHRRSEHSASSRSESSKRSGRSSSKRRKSSTRASSSFAPTSVAPSRAPVGVRRSSPAVPAECAGFIWALLGVCVLILLGGGHHACALGFALVLPGLALLIRPPVRSLGKWMDFGVVGVLGTLLFAFVPLFYWKFPEWRVAAVEDFGIELPWTLSVQPWVSFEAWLL